MESLAEYYSANLSQNVKRGLYDSALERKKTFRTYGYKRGKDGKYEIDPVTGPIVRRIFEEYASGKPMPDIIDGLNADGVRTVFGGEFKTNSIRRMIRNEKYIGVYRYRDIVDPDGIPPIVTPELFQAVQDEIKKRAHNYTKRKPKPARLSFNRETVLRLLFVPYGRRFRSFCERKHLLLVYVPERKKDAENVPKKARG